MMLYPNIDCKFFELLENQYITGVIWSNIDVYSFLTGKEYLKENDFSYFHNPKAKIPWTIKKYKKILAEKFHIDPSKITMIESDDYLS